MVGAGSFKNKDITNTALNINWNNIVRLLNLLELRVNKSFI